RPVPSGLRGELDRAPGAHRALGRAHLPGGAEHQLPDPVGGDGGGGARDPIGAARRERAGVRPQQRGGGRARPDRGSGPRRRVVAGPELRRRGVRDRRTGLPGFRARAVVEPALGQGPRVRPGGAGRPARARPRRHRRGRPLRRHDPDHAAPRGAGRLTPGPTRRMRVVACVRQSTGHTRTWLPSGSATTKVRPNTSSWGSSTTRTPRAAHRAYTSSTADAVPGIIRPTSLVRGVPGTACSRRPAQRANNTPGATSKATLRGLVNDGSISKMLLYMVDDASKSVT